MTPCRQRVEKALIRPAVHYAQRIMLQAFAPTAAVVRKSLRITVVRQYSNVDLFVLGYALAVIPAVIGAIVRFVGNDRRLGLSVLSLN